MSDDQATGLSATELRKAGMPLPAIAEHLKRSKEDVEREILATLRDKHHVDYLTDEDRLTLERYDTLIRSNWVKAVGGEIKAINAVRNIEKDRSALVAERLKGTKRLTPDQSLTQDLQGLIRKLTDKSSEEDSQ